MKGFRKLGEALFGSGIAERFRLGALTGKSSGDFTISGNVFVSGAGVSGVAVALGTLSANTDANGDYSLSVPGGTSGSLTFTKVGYTFLPITIVAVSGNLANQNPTVTSITPTLGSNLLVDPGIENWTDPTHPTNWTVSLSGGSTVTQDTTHQESGASCAALNVDGSGSSVSIAQTVATTIGAWYQYIARLASVIANTPTATVRAAHFAATASSPATSLTPAYKDVPITGRELNISETVSVVRGSATSKSFVSDNNRFQQISLPSCIATKKVSASSAVIVAQRLSVIGGTQQGFIICANSLSAPTSFIHVYVDKAKIFVDKCVGGTWSAVGNVTQVWTNNDELKFTFDGISTGALYYNGAPVGGPYTISDAQILGNTLHADFSTWGGNSFNNELSVVANP